MMSFNKFEETDKSKMTFLTPPTRLRVEKALRERAMRRRSAAPTWGRTVEGAVRAVLPVIEEVKPDLTWDEIAGVLAEAGVSWRNGRPVSGADLRSVVHRLRMRARAASVGVSHEGMRPTSGVGSEGAPRKGQRGSPMEGTKAADAGGMDRTRILREMARAAFERRNPRSSEKDVAAEGGSAKMMEAHPTGVPSP
jgi:hypothetical protein